MRELRPAGDHLYLAQAGQQFRREGRFVLGDRLLLDGNLHEVAISTAEGKMTVTPSEAPCLPVKMAMDTDLMTLCTRDGAHGLMMYRPGKTPKVPEGSYRILDYVAFRNDSKGSRWLLYARGSAEAPLVDIQGEGAELTFGEPFVPWVEVPKWSRDNYLNGGMNEVQLALNIEGAAKEFVGNLTRVSGSASEIPLSSRRDYLPKEPLYKVAKPDGEVVAQGNFEYG
jgi:hypothetical protein